MRAAKSVLHCFVHDLYDGQWMRPEILAAWQALREWYGNHEESRGRSGHPGGPRLPELSGPRARRTASSNAGTRARADPNDLEHVCPDHPKDWTVSDHLDTDRADSESRVQGPGHWP